ncbi:hypothetical protein [Nonomuraea sp. NPDC046570]|uniref:hypothetical protein n=1 Tax=Nonomuraea sp. NPDC046570 TaxID=3155255 RepID=UPI0033D870A5
MTLSELTIRFAHDWVISEGVGAGWYAIRREGTARRGLSDVRCGATPAELARHLEDERNLEIGCFDLR